MEERTYEIVWADGTRQRLQATYVSTRRDRINGAMPIEFRGPSDRPDGGFAARLLLASVVAPNAIISVRDVAADVVTVTATRQRRWRSRPLGKRRNR